MASEDVKAAVATGHWREMYAVKVELASPIRLVDAERPLYLDLDGAPAPQLLALPYLYTFEGVAAGPMPTGWAESGFSGWNFVAPTVVANKSAGWNPNRPCAWFANSGTKASHSEFTLPAPVDASAGFRFCFWLVSEVQLCADGSIWVGNGFGNYAATGSEFCGIRLTPRSVNPQDLARSGYANGPGVLHTPASVLGSSGPQYWCRYDLEWKPALPQLYTKVTRVDNSSSIHNSTITPTWGADVAAAWESFSHFTIQFPSEMNQYYRDYWLLGFWIGSLTDDWPALQMPTSL